MKIFYILNITCFRAMVSRKSFFFTFYLVFIISLPFSVLKELAHLCIIKNSKSSIHPFKLPCVIMLRLNFI